MAMSSWLDVSVLSGVAMPGLLASRNKLWLSLLQSRSFQFRRLRNGLKLEGMLSHSFSLALKVNHRKTDNLGTVNTEICETEPQGTVC